MKKNSTDDNLVLEEFLAPANFLMRLSIKAYQKYMHNKIYLHALNIRKANEMIYQLLLDKIKFIPAPLQMDCIELLNHYDCWILQFKEEEKKREPLMADEFIFERIDDQVAFPQLAEQRILEMYTQYNKQKK